MKIRVLAVGRLKTGPERAMAEDYRARAETFGRKAGIAAVGVSDAAESRADTAARRMAEEAGFLTGPLAQRAFAVALDSSGKTFTSPAFADFLTHQAASGTGEVAFLIGGPDGLAASVRQQSGLVLSLGTMTWPHRLVRVMLLEQIYRAVTIMVNHPYHRS
jgi:23S rRNA (pseudouridine1915-N3)-methyltransferase